MIINNLLKQNLIKKGTWIGVSSNHTCITHRYVVEQVTDHHSVIVTDPAQNCKLKIPPDVILEIDGMNLTRFCAQADLDAEGIKIQNMKRRGRKPKHLK